MQGLVYNTNSTVSCRADAVEKLAIAKLRAPLRPKKVMMHIYVHIGLCVLEILDSRGILLLSPSWLPGSCLAWKLGELMRRIFC